MRNTVVGFVAGLSVMGLTYLLFLSPSHAPSESSSKAGADESSQSQSDSEPVLTERDGAVDGSFSDVPTPRRGEEPDSFDVEPVFAEAGQVQGQEPDALTGSDPPALPITLPPQFDYLQEDTMPWHESLQRQPVDPNWSAQAETELNAYIAANPEITDKYGIPTIHCRMTGCLAAFVSFDPALAEAGGLLGASLIFREDNQEFFEGSWAQQFSDQVGVVSDSHRVGGVTTIYWMLARDEQQTNSVASSLAQL